MNVTIGPFLNWVTHTRHVPGSCWVLSIQAVLGGELEACPHTVEWLV